MRRSAIITASVVALTLAACGRDDEDTDATKNTADATTTATTTGDAQRYCALTRRLDAAGEKFFADLGQDARPAQFEAAERRFITQFSAELDGLRRAAPPEIDADVETLLASQRQRAGLAATPKVDEATASAAETRIRAWERRSCDS